MGYLVLARKYRPQAFSDMTGQEHVVQTLSNAMKSGRVAHAHLFCGPRGCGKTTTARIVAKALNCENGPTPEPCGVCTPCREITAGTDVDVQEIDAASNTGVDNVRELRESAKYLPARDRFKIFIVDEVHMLSKAAFNAFLKTLEEPPGHVKFLFATTDPQALPDTILSRCQRHNFRLVPLKQISERIRAIATAESVTIDDGAVALVARQAAGSMRDALSILDQLFSSVTPGASITETMAAQALGALDRTVVSDLAEAMLRRDASGVLGGISRAYDGGHDLKRLAEELATHLRNLVACSVSGAPLDLPDHEVRALRQQASSVDPASLARLFDLAHGALGEMSRATQPRHALEVALLKAVFLAPSAGVQTLLSRTEELARKLGVAVPPPPSGGGGGGGLAPTRTDSAAPVRTRPSFEAGPTPSASAAPSPQAQAPAFAPSAAPRAAAPAAPVAAVPVSRTVAVVSTPAPAARPAAPAQNPWERRLSVVPAPASEPAAENEEMGMEPALVSAPPVAVAAAPVPAPAPLPTPIVAAPQPVENSPARVELMQRWGALVAALKERRRSVGSLLEHARPVALDGAVLTLGLSKGDFHAQQLIDSRKAVEALLSEEFGTPVELRITELSAADSAGVRSLAEETEHADRAAKAARLKAGREHPAILEAAQILGAEIEDVRDLGGATA